MAFQAELNNQLVQLPKRFHLTGKSTGFYSQTPKLEPLLKRFHFNGNTIGFHPQTPKLDLHTK